MALQDQDIRDSQDGQRDGLEDVGSRVSGGNTIQGAGTSPRHTRSGRIFTYTE